MKRIMFATALLFAGLSIAGASVPACQLSAWTSWTGVSFAASTCPTGYCRTPAGCCNLATKQCACM